MSDDYNIEIQQGRMYWAPISPEVENAWKPTPWWRRLLLRLLRRNGEWVDIGYTEAGDE